MAATTDSVLFSWHHVEQFPQLKKLQLVLDVLPYRAFVEELARRRGRGRNDYPVEAMFRLLVSGILQQPIFCVTCTAIRSWPMSAVSIHCRSSSARSGFLNKPQTITGALNRLFIRGGCRCLMSGRFQGSCARV